MDTKDVDDGGMVAKIAAWIGAGAGRGLVAMAMALVAVVVEAPRGVTRSAWSNEEAGRVDSGKEDADEDDDEGW